MAKSFDQFSGEGQKYAPKAKPKAMKPAESFKAAPSSAPSAEDNFRDTYRDESKLRDQRPVNPRAQSTDHMNGKY